MKLKLFKLRRFTRVFNEAICGCIFALQLPTFSFGRSEFSKQVPTQTMKQKRKTMLISGLIHTVRFRLRPRPFDLSRCSMWMTSMGSSLCRDVTNTDRNRIRLNCSNKKANVKKIVHICRLFKEWNIEIAGILVVNRVAFAFAHCEWAEVSEWCTLDEEHFGFTILSDLFTWLRHNKRFLSRYQLSEQLIAQ